MRDLASSKKAAPKKRKLKIGKPLQKARLFKLIRLPDNKFGRLLKRVGRFLIPEYFRAAWGEIKQTTWPNRKETTRLTIAVFIFSIIFATFVAGLDFALDKMFKNLITK
jgi:preprotein translocase SecE subunit